MAVLTTSFLNRRNPTSNAVLRPTFRFVNNIAATTNRLRGQGESNLKARVAQNIRITRERINAESGGRFDLTQVSLQRSIGPEVLIAKTDARSRFRLNHTVNNLKLISTASLRERLNFTTGFIDGINFEPQSVGSLHTFGTPGLAGQFFPGPWRTTIATGNIGTLPLTSPTIFNSISYREIGESYGFIAIGYFKPPTTGTYTFFTSSDDYSGVWLGDIAAATSGRTSANAVVNNGMDLGAPGQPNTKRSGTIALVAGVSYPIRIVHEEGGGGDNLTFSWSGPGIAETTNLSQYFTVTTEKIGERVSVSSAATESLSFTTRLRQRIAAESNATFDLTQVSSDGELFVSNNLIAKAAGAARLRFESIINNIDINSTPSLRQRLNFTTRLVERANLSSLNLEFINFTTRIRDRAVSHSSTLFTFADVFSEKPLFDSSILIAKTAGKIHLSLDSSINILEVKSTPSLRERLNFTTRLVERANPSSLNLELLDFTTRLRDRISAQSTATFDLTQVSSDGELFVSNTLIAKTRGTSQFSIESTINNVEVKSTPSLRERLNFRTNLHEKKQADSEGLEQINFTTRLRDRISAESSAKFSILDTFSEGELFVSNALSAKTKGTIQLSIESIINNIEVKSTPSLRERLNFRTGFIDGINFESQSVGSLNAFGTPGLAGQFFPGIWRSTADNGTVGTLPLFSPTIFNSISYAEIDDEYGFIAIGYFKPPTTGTYTFFTSSADSSGVWLGTLAASAGGRNSGNALVNNGLGQAQPVLKRSGSIALVEEVWYPIRIVHESRFEGDTLTFSWSGPDIEETTDLSQHFAVTTEKKGERVSVPSAATESLSFTTRIRQRIVAESNGNIDLTQVSSEGALFISNRLAVKSVASENIDFTRDIASTIDAKSSLRSRISVRHALGPERINSDSGGRITNIRVSGGPGLALFRERVSAISDARITISDTTFGPFIGWGIPL
jgi:hypothetical protein